MANKNLTPNQSGALADLKISLRRSDNMETFKRAVLETLKYDCSDAEMGKAIRLAIMESALLPRRDKKPVG